MLKKSIITVLALTVIGSGFAQAQTYHPPRHNEGPRAVERHAKPPRPDMKRNDRRDFKRHHWSKGQRFGDWRRHKEVRDYKRYGLRRPAPGQRWVKVDDQFLLITAATGLIAGIMAAR